MAEAFKRCLPRSEETEGGEMLPYARENSFDKTVAYAFGTKL
jgi:hypothetical protein